MFSKIEKGLIEEKADAETRAMTRTNLVASLAGCGAVDRLAKIKNVSLGRLGDEWSEFVGDV